MPPFAQFRPAVGPLEPRHLPSVPFEQLPVVPAITGREQVRLQEVAERGRQLGNRPDVFAKAGDSITANWSQSFMPLGRPGYSPVLNGLAGRPDLVATWAAYLAPVGLAENSFSRTSLSAFPGWRSDEVAARAAAEVDAVRPAVALVMVGTNDAAHGDIGRYRANLRALATTYLDRGVVPVLSTIPENTTSPGFRPWTRAVNQAVADVADEFAVPVWNYWKAVDGLPAAGLADGVHPNTAPQGGGYFGPGGLGFGYNVRNFTALEVLTKLREVVFADAPADDFGVPQSLAWQTPPAGDRLAAAGSPAGYAPAVRLYDPDTGAFLTQFLAYEPTFRGGVRVATGDVDGDGVPDVVAAAGPGGGPVVKAFAGADGRELWSFHAFEPGFRGGRSVAVGDLDGDAVADVVVGAGKGGGPRVRAFRGTDLAPLADFLALDGAFRGGLSVAVGDFGAGVGRAIAVGAGPGGGAVGLYSADGARVRTLAVFDEPFRGGVNVAAGDLDGDGAAELVGGAAEGSTRVRG